MWERWLPAAARRLSAHSLCKKLSRLRCELRDEPMGCTNTLSIAQWRATMSRWWP